MPVFVVPSLLKFALGVGGAAAIVHWAVKEVRRLGEEFERAKVMASDRREALPTLRRDPATGVWRVM